MTRLPCHYHAPIDTQRRQGNLSNPRFVSSYAPLRNPTTGIAACCALAASGPMNSRRFN
jgi:hypothetical protein